MLEWPKQWKLSERILSWYLSYLYFILKPPHNVVSQSLSVWFEICQCTNLKFTVYPLVFLKVAMSTISQIFVFEKWDTKGSKASNTLTSCVAKVRMLKAQWLLGAEFYIERKKHRPPEQSTLKRQHSTYHSSPCLEKVWTLVCNSLVKICWQHFHNCKFQEVTHPDTLTTLLWVGGWCDNKMGLILCPFKLKQFDAKQIRLSRPYSDTPAALWCMCHLSSSWIWSSKWKNSTIKEGSTFLNNWVPESGWHWRRLTQIREVSNSVGHKKDVG